jgi:TonB family protein
MKRVVKMRKAILGLLLTAVAGVAAAEEPLVFWTTVAVDVDARGGVVAVQPDETLSVALQKLVREQAQRWRFEPPRVDGVAASGRTYARLKACAVPDSEGYRIALDYQGAGPRHLGGTLLEPPRYPAIASSNGRETTATVTYVVGDDGQVALEAIRHVDARMARYFDKTLEEWVGALRYVPEELDGRPVSARIEISVSFSLKAPGSRPSPPKAVSQQWPESAECRAAPAHPGDWQRPVVLDSPFRKLPSG